jgi:hypothetical protein
MQTSVATVTIRGITSLSQSRRHADPRKEGENPEDYDNRTWRSKLSVENGSVVLPAHGVHQAIAAAAKYSKRQIPGQGKSTWTAKFMAGIAILEDPRLNIDPETVSSVVISANSDGVRGSGRRVPRRYPMIPEWQTTFEVYILDPIITESVFTEMLTISGMFIGLGRFRPEKGGTNGRFQLVELQWQDNRQLLAA